MVSYYYKRQSSLIQHVDIYEAALTLIRMEQCSPLKDERMRENEEKNKGKKGTLREAATTKKSAKVVTISPDQISRGKKIIFMNALTHSLL